jgi:hypothetical protein
MKDHLCSHVVSEAILCRDFSGLIPGGIITNDGEQRRFLRADRAVDFNWICYDGQTSDLVFLHQQTQCQLVVRLCFVLVFRFSQRVRATNFKGNRPMYPS